MAEISLPSFSNEANWSANNSSYQICIDLDVNCVFIEHTNTLTVDLIIERYEEIFTSPFMRTGLNYFVKYSESTNKTTSDDIRRLADYLRDKQDLRGQCKQAVLCNTKVGYGYSRMLDSLYNAKQKAEDSKVKTMIYNLGNFRDSKEPIKQGLIWLGITPDYQHPF